MQSVDRLNANELDDRCLESLKALWSDRLLPCGSSIALQYAHPLVSPNQKSHGANLNHLPLHRAGRRNLTQRTDRRWHPGHSPRHCGTLAIGRIATGYSHPTVRPDLDNQPEIDGYIEWYRSRPPLNVPVELRLNPLRDEVEQAIQATRQAENHVHDRASS
jgi:hypothetical protein